MKSLKRFAILLVTMLLIGFLAACGQGEDSSGDTEDQNSQEETNAGNDSEEHNEDTKELSGTIKLAGSSTVFPIMEAVTYEYHQIQPNVQTPLESVGSGGGFKKSTKGEIDFSNASRPIKPEEQQIAEENGIQLEEIVLAYDGLTVAVSLQNDFVDSLTVEQLRDIFLAERGNTKWSDIHPDWPDEPIKIYAPGHDSGTFDYFNEVILEEKEMREGEGVTLSEDDNLLVRGIQDDPYAIGFFGYAYYYANQNKLKAVAIDGGDGPVEPNSDTIQDGTYTPLSRPLFTYVNVQSLKEKEHVQDFLEFLMNGSAAKAAEQVGYVPIPEEEYQKQLEELQKLYQ
ncbi:phosphate ABC transporter substrate-binding protein (PhoT family) [Melghiribacillus thermohalophilus]|uniref:Phosphate-binding protein n=1 Tax=Melghiribacillus thermohalophilus TaxID=1324956 RepID=A0A4R3NDI5_9BACI|nr:PstS family phosphate ABC transporter substrate-binding protein [Melghiribacillus thermohalophilus]TCT26980.1 phosphate ABC transporter substrate-binding protein (PhoT family) [Melghiribacillus thermohalophilus]